MEKVVFKFTKISAPPVALAKVLAHFLLALVLLSSLPVKTVAEVHVAINLQEKNGLNHEVTGKVTNPAGEPLVGVTVIPQGSKNGTVTDVNGNFSITLENSNGVLIFSYIGYHTQRMSLNGRTNLNIILTPVSRGLNEIIVVGYGKQKKIDLTGSVASMGSDQLKDRPITNISSAMEGRMPGVTVLQRSGQPGNDQGNIFIRGIGTMNNANPLVIVDGIESSMDNLNPNDIESISVLKDAASASIYGSRAANGVIIITTKRGKIGTPKVSYSSYLGWQEPVNLPQWLDSYHYAKLLNEGLENEGASPKYTAEDLKKFQDGSDPIGHPNTDWNALFFNGSGFQQSHNINVSGGNQTGKYFFSLGYLDQDGIVKKTNYKRYNIRVNLDSKVSNFLSFGLTSSLSREITNEPVASQPGGTFGRILIAVNRIPPTELNKNPDGSWNREVEGNPNAWRDEGGIYNEITSNILTDIFAELTIAKGLKLKGSMGFDYSIMDAYDHKKVVFYGDGGSNSPSSVTDLITRNMHTKPQALLTYNKKFKENKIKLLLGTSQESFVFKTNSAYRNDFPNNELTGLSAGATSGMKNSGSGYDNRMVSYFGRVNYEFKGRYLFQANVRNDLSSKFAEDKRSGWFPSFSAGWIISKESFFKNVDFVNNLKIRASYGTVGNNATDNYQYLNKVSLGQNYPFGGVINSGAAQTTASSPNLKWETSNSFDIGVDLSLLDDKITFSGDFYNRYTYDILISVPVTSIYGLPSPVVNGGAMRNKGFEFTIGHSNSIGDFSYNVIFNAGFNKNNTVAFPNPTKGNRIYEEGYPWGGFYGYKYIGLYQTDKQVENAPKVVGAPVQKGDLMFKDQNGDEIINGDDRIFLGSDIPKVSYGLNIEANYKNFDLLIFGQGTADVYQLLPNNVLFPFINGYKAMKPDLDRWTPETPHARNPIIHVVQSYNYDVPSSFTVRNSSYFRLKTIQIGYTFHNLQHGKFKINQVRLYLSARNLFTLVRADWEDRGYSPEAPSSTAANWVYPNVKVFTGGININF